MLINGANLSLPAINHIGVVVRDIDATGKSLSLVFGCGFGQVFDYVVREDMLLKGSPFSLRIAAAKLGFTTYEFLQPVKGKSIWADFLESYGEGLHHVAFTVTDWERNVARLEKAGAKLLAGASVEHQQNKRWAYLDTRVGGLIVELMEDYGF